MTEYFPGSMQRIPDAVPERPLPKGRTFTVRGEDVQMFTLGELAAALNRKPVTVRKWETDKVIPRATFVRPGKGGDVRGRRRYYTQPQVEGLVRIAREEGILTNPNKPLKSTRFSERAWSLFRSLAGDKK